MGKDRPDRRPARPALALVRGDAGEDRPPTGGDGGEPSWREAIVLRYGELTLKGDNRRRFIDAVVRSIRRALAEIGAAVRPVHGRCFVEGVGHSADALARLRLVFGLSSASPVWVLPADVESWERLAALRGRFAAARGLRTFAIDTLRPDKTFPARSRDVSVRLGDAVRAATGLKVDLDLPEWVFHVEIGREAIFAYEGILPGAGGLPVGMGGRAMLLLSGGIDSPVAGHLAQKRGVTLDAVYFHSFPHTGPGAREKAVDLARMLARAQGRLDLHVVPFARVQETLRDHAPADHLVILYRRAMVRIAERLAAGAGASALVTGESLGQVASQTIENIRCIDAAATLPILRPLISFDKSETIALARRLGTFETSIRPHADCCALFVAKHPVTRGLPDRVERIEAGVPLAGALDEAVAGTEVVRVGEDE